VLRPCDRLQEQLTFLIARQDTKFQAIETVFGVDKCLHDSADHSGEQVATKRLGFDIRLMNRFFKSLRTLKSLGNVI
jgi:hypothetical protein